MAGILSEQTPWKNILQLSVYVHALFNDIDDYCITLDWGNDFKLTREKLKGYKASNTEGDWPIIQITWHKMSGILSPK